MTAPPRERLYSPEMLALATKLAEFPPVEGAALHGEASSRTCGSSIRMSLDVDDGGAVTRIGMRVAACAVGQAAAAIFAQAAERSSASDIARTLAAMEAWLGGAGEMPDWPGLAAVAAGREFPARHGAMLLPWRAALDALSKAGAAG